MIILCLSELTKNWKTFKSRVESLNCKILLEVCYQDLWWSRIQGHLNFSILLQTHQDVLPWSEDLLKTILCWVWLSVGSLFLSNFEHIICHKGLMLPRAMFTFCAQPTIGKTEKNFCISLKINFLVRCRKISPQCCIITSVANLINILR